MFFRTTLLSLFVLASVGQAKVFDFHIAPGTGKNHWNTRDAALEVRVHDVVRIINDDTIPHRLHTNGKPCAHGAVMAANGGFYDCEIDFAYNPDELGPLYDHDHSESKFWIRAVE